MDKQKSNLSTDEKIFISFFITPAVPAAIFSAFALSNLIVIVISFVVTYLIAGAHVLVLGLPAFLLGKRLNAIHWWTCIVVAFLIGGLPIAIWHGWSEFGWWGLFGASGGFGFWLLWQFWIHPDQ